MDRPVPIAQVSSGWTDTVKFIAPPGATVVFAIDREGPRGELMPALARLCVQMAARRAAALTGQRSELPGAVPGLEMSR